MALISYTGIQSLDGFIADAQGNFDWSTPDLDVHRFVNDLERPVSIHLYGRRLYDVMAAWEEIGTPNDPSASQANADPVSEAMVDYGEIWRAAEKIVFSTTLNEPRTTRTRIERAFDPDAIRSLAAKNAGEISLGGARLAAQALEAGLVDELRLFVSPVVVGDGIRFLPAGLRLDLELTDERRFGNGVVFLRYKIRR
ncbi:dihydrofolate reductase [Okibacterium sp. HSC-33S16]|uniref:dihydrofolate reductase family protein n=1 Tax=Okibacterium sp. HSC-33S16 TaxID=2910965 RepID=UPI0020A22FBE|nr:dihydrofolate reductase family protein [Okibacterium sp. HSC-33S16]MCP2031504.1 dihydrofolate reductase [Okibacterium sp. HSC-33S16]